ncbi:hypothetical protein B0H16DRAFT_1879580 [Mycena metata]|uniref:Uncharacterized protein n=1 Tax=Mycena metata TaxID=1033252 RepID=A0AAD7NV05_9AGAR|nr:hypothetical protein B0H16DRAFT_1879580 [Mycena metata]
MNDEEAVVDRVSDSAESSEAELRDLPGPLLPNLHHLFNASFNTLRLSVSQVVERRHPLDALPPSRAFGGSSLISSGVRAKSSPPLLGGGVDCGDCSFPAGNADSRRAVAWAASYPFQPAFTTQPVFPLPSSMLFRAPV